MALWPLLKIGDPGVDGLGEGFLAFLIASPKLLVLVASVDVTLGLEIDFLAFTAALGCTWF